MKAKKIALIMIKSLIIIKIANRYLKISACTLPRMKKWGWSVIPAAENQP